MLNNIINLKKILYYQTIFITIYGGAPRSFANANSLKFVKPIEFVIIIPSYNNEKWCEENIYSAATQDYPAYEIVYINDNSKDKTKIKAEEYIKKNNFKNITIINNSTRQGALKNLFNAIHKTADHKVIVMLDGDDKFPHNRVLTRLSKDYMTGKTWMTFGQFKYAKKNEGVYCRAFPEIIIQQNKFRQYEWVASHLRTGYAGLFKKINREDLLYKNEFCPVVWDLALMYPALEMASKGHITFIPDILYVYNDNNPISDHKTSLNLIPKVRNHVLKLRRYTPLDKLDCINYYVTN